jgi:hypothetical protein
MNIIRVVCANPQCGTILRIQARQAGKRIRCPKCKIDLLAPQIPGITAEGLGEGEAEAEDIDARPSCWMTLLFLAGLFAGFVLVVAGAVGFEVYLYLDAQPINLGQAATLLGKGPWKTLPHQEKPAAEASELPIWAKAGMVWTFLPNGKAESGPVRAEVNRYDRSPANGFRTWTWSTDGDVVKLVSSGIQPVTTVEFAVTEETDKLVLAPMSEGDPLLVLAKTEPLKTFPDLRVVFYAGVVAPMLVAMLLAWLISRELVWSGCLRFALGWPLTILLGVALGAGAGYLLDVLNDFNYNPAPYWMLLAFAQGVLGLGTGLALAILSCLRP